MALRTIAVRASGEACWDVRVLELVERIGCKTASWRRKGNNHLGWFSRLRNQRTGYGLVLERITATGGEETCHRSGHSGGRRAFQHGKTPEGCEGPRPFGIENVW